jgi:hypothetical protein
MNCSRRCRSGSCPMIQSTSDKRRSGPRVRVPSSR